MPAYTITEAKIELLAAALEKGATYSAACRALNISPNTWKRYLAHARQLYDGRLERENYPDEYLHILQLIIDRVVTARAKAELKFIERIADAGEADWRANAYLLEKSYHGWGKNDQPEEIDEGIEEEVIDVTALSSHELAQLVAGEDEDV